MDFAAILLDFYWHHGLTVFKFIPKSCFLSPLFQFLDPEHIKILVDNVVNSIRIRKVTVMDCDFFLIWALIYLLENFLDFFWNGKLLLCTDSFSTKRIPFMAKISFDRLFDVCFNGSGNDGLNVSGIGPVKLGFFGFNLFGLVFEESRGLVIWGWDDLKGRYCGMDGISDG